MVAGALVMIHIECPIEGNPQTWEGDTANEVLSRGKDGGTLGRIERLPVCSFIFLGMGRKLLLKEPHLTTIRAKATPP